MSINDIELAAFIIQIQKNSRSLTTLESGGHEMALFMALSDIQRAAEKAQWRLNDLLYGRGYKPPVEMMGN